MKKDKDTFIFICSESTWKIRYNGTIDGSKLTLYYRDEDSGHYDCPTKDSVEVVHSSLTVKFRSECSNFSYTTFHKCACDSLKKKKTMSVQFYKV